jgi:hypothetical protein
VSFIARHEISGIAGDGKLDKSIIRFISLDYRQSW